jgi:Mrp family chromosome partitioning ATPase
VIDTAPLSLVADAIPLMKRVDGVIVVSRLGLSRRDASSRLRDRLDKLGAPMLGVVVNDVSRRGGSYDYGYGYDAAYSPPESPAPPPSDMSGDRELTSSSQAASISEN